MTRCGEARAAVSPSPYATLVVHPSRGRGPLRRQGILRRIQCLLNHVKRRRRDHRWAHWLSWSSCPTAVCFRLRTSLVLHASEVHEINEGRLRMWCLVFRG